MTNTFTLCCSLFENIHVKPNGHTLPDPLSLYNRRCHKAVCWQVYIKIAIFYMWKPQDNVTTNYMTSPYCRIHMWNLFWLLDDSVAIDSEGLMSRFYRLMGIFVLHGALLFLWRRFKAALANWQARWLHKANPTASLARQPLLAGMGLLCGTTPQPDVISLCHASLAGPDPFPSSLA